MTTRKCYVVRPEKWECWSARRLVNDCRIDRSLQSRLRSIGPNTIVDKPKAKPKFLEILLAGMMAAVVQVASPRSRRFVAPCPSKIQTFHELLAALSVDLPEISLCRIANEIRAADEQRVELKKGENVGSVDKVTSLPVATLDHLALICADQALSDPSWSLLAGRLVSFSISQLVPPKFSEAMIKLTPVLADGFLRYVRDNAEALDAIVCPDRDYRLDLFAIRTLQKSYLGQLKAHGTSTVVETPQYLYLRVATYLWMDTQYLAGEATTRPNHLGMSDIPDPPGATVLQRMENCMETPLQRIAKVYDALSRGQVSQASPTMFNAGMRRPQLASCFLGKIDDNMQSINKSWGDSAIISMNSGGLGYSYSHLRHSEIGHHGKSRGVIPWLKIKNEILCSVDQAGRRKGSETAYLRDCHLDAFEFAECKGEGPDDMRARDLFYAFMVSDLFMQRVHDDGEWCLFCPNKARELFDKWGIEFEMEYLSLEKAGSASRTIRARDLWFHILNQQIKTGMPFIVYMDAINRKSNQKHSGVINNSNLCVAGDTLVMTRSGNQQIDKIVDTQQDVWNGEEWSRVMIRQTSTAANLLRVTFDGGAVLDCTPQHKFYLRAETMLGGVTETAAAYLQPGERLTEWGAPNEPQYRQTATVASVTDGPQAVPTYCFTEPLRHRGMFNNIVTGQCVEIAEITSEKEIASCNLASVALTSCVGTRADHSRYFDFDLLENLTRLLVRNLNQIIERNYYPPEIPEIGYANFRHRPIGIGVQGLADAVAMLDYAWVVPTSSIDESVGPSSNVADYSTSPQVKVLNQQIFETMYYAAISESMELAKHYGKYPTFDGSPTSKGYLQFDLWGQERLEKEIRAKAALDPEVLLDYLKSRSDSSAPFGPFDSPSLQPRYTRDQWDRLRDKVRTYGLRNSLLLALMPTASSAHILGNAESFEPFNEYLYSRTVLSGQFLIVNHHVVTDLRKIGLWNTDTVRSIVACRGSVAGLHTTPAVAALSISDRQRLAYLQIKYRTIYEIPQRVLVELSADRGHFICQTQSFNCHMASPTVQKLTAYHFAGHAAGLKTGMYYLRQKAASDPINFAMATLSIDVSSTSKVPGVTGVPDQIVNTEATSVRRLQTGQICNEEVCMACSV